MESAVILPTKQTYNKMVYKANLYGIFKWNYEKIEKHFVNQLLSVESYKPIHTFYYIMNYMKHEI